MRPNSSDAIADALRHARAALETGRAADAERIASDILKANAGHREVAKVLGYALMMLGRNDEAVAVLEKAARGNRDAEADMALGIALRQSGRSDDSIVALRRATKRTPLYPMAFYELGRSLAALNQLDEAIAVFKQGLTVAPGMVDMTARLGNCYLAAGDRKNARQCFERVLMQTPGHYPAAEALGIILMDDRDYAQGAALFRAMAAADPGNAHAQLGLANCQLHLGKHDAALASMKAASAQGAKYYGQALRIAVSAQRGRFWLRPSAAAKAIKD